MPAIDKISTEKHDGDVIVVVYHDNNVFSGGADGQIKIWDNNLNLLKTLKPPEASYIYAMALNSLGKLYFSSCDGWVRFVTKPYEIIQDLFYSNEAISAMYCENDILYAGDEKGVISNWINDKLIFKYNLVEEVKSLAVESNWIYTVRDWDVVVSEIVSGKSGKYATRAVLEGKSPLVLLGPMVEERHKYLAYPDRTGKGLILIKNTLGEKFANNWHLKDCHEMIINGICGDETHLFSGGYDNKVKSWTDLDQTTPTALGAVDTGSCVNSICCGNQIGYVYIACSDGLIRRAKF